MSECFGCHGPMDRPRGRRGWAPIYCTACKKVRAAVHYVPAQRVGVSITCTGCGEAFQRDPAARNPRRWCSEACRVRTHRAAQRVRSPRACRVCRSPVVGKKQYCSPACQVSAASGRKPTRRTSACRWCAAEFRPWQSRHLYCSKPCARSGKIDLRPANHNRPGVRARGSISAVSRRFVYDRDEWTCWICRDSVPAIRGRSTLAPSIDHVIPLALGGSHDHSNLRLAHFGCNSRRGARVA